MSPLAVAGPRQTFQQEDCDESKGTDDPRVQKLFHAYQAIAGPRSRRQPQDRFSTSSRRRTVALAGPAVRCRERALALVVELHPERLDGRRRRAADRQRGVGGMPDTDEPGGLAHPLRDVILDIDRNLVADPEVVLVTAVAELDRLLFNPQDLADQRRETRHRPAHLA